MEGKGREGEGMKAEGPGPHIFWPIEPPLQLMLTFDTVHKENIIFWYILSQDKCYGATYLPSSVIWYR